jgi:hypothetical protein
MRALTINLIGVPLRADTKKAAHDEVRVVTSYIVAGVPMNTCIQGVCWESHHRVPKGGHTLEPNMLKGPLPQSSEGGAEVPSDRKLLTTS